MYPNLGIIVLPLVLVCVCLISCGSLCRTSKGAIHTSEPENNDSLKNGIEEYVELVAKLVPGEQSPRLLKIGHMAGSYKQYPKSIDKIEKMNEPVDSLIARGQLQHVADLIEFSFKDLELDAVEIDVQMGWGRERRKRVIYVTHDPIKQAPDEYSEDVSRYLQSNRLDSVLSKFIESGYFREKGLFIEFKCKRHDRLSESDSLVIRGTLNTIADVVKSRAWKSSEEKEVFLGHVGFASFNLGALVEAARYDSIKAIYKDVPNHSRPKLFYIASSNRFVGRLASVLPWTRSLNFLSRKMLKKIAEFRELTGVWFDPCGVKDFVDSFSRKIISHRSRLPNPPPPLEFHISTYKLGKGEFEKRILREKGQMEAVKGMVFDINLEKRIRKTAKD